MASMNVRLPEEQKKKIKNAAEKGDYPSPSEWVREAIRDKLKQETLLSPEEVERILKTWEKKENGELETVSAEQVWEELGVE
jgi:Arc/MetJ-type ribon-helix-helix transcriptional regulator